MQTPKLHSIQTTVKAPLHWTSHHATTQHNPFPHRKLQSSIHNTKICLIHEPNTTWTSVPHTILVCYLRQYGTTKFDITRYSITFHKWGPTTITHTRNHSIQFQPEASKQNIYTATLNKTQRHITNTEVTTAHLPDLSLWYENLPPIYDLYNAGRPIPPWPLPTKFSCKLTPTANTDPTLSDHPKATRHDCAWQHPDHLTHTPLRAIALSTYYPWTIRNKHLHPTDPQQADPSQLATIQQIFHNVQNEPNLWDILNYTTAEAIMTQPTCTIRQRVNYCHNHIHNQQKAVKIWANLHNHDICQHFIRKIRPQPKTSDKNLLRPP